jgi:hypothetical protein
LAGLGRQREGLERQLEIPDEGVGDEPDAGGVDSDVVGGPADSELVAAGGHGSHNTGTVRDDIDAFYATTEALAPEDIADGIAYMVTRPRHASIGELWIMPTDQV